MMCLDGNGHTDHKNTIGFHIGPIVFWIFDVTIIWSQQSQKRKNKNLKMIITSILLNRYKNEWYKV